MDGLEASTLGRGFAVFTPRIVPFREFIVLPCADTGERYVRFNFSRNLATIT